MSESITKSIVHLLELAKDNPEQINKAIEQLNAGSGAPKESKQTHTRWRAEEDEVYYWVQDSGAVVFKIDDYDNIDNFRFSFGNYFMTLKEAVEYRNRQLAIMRVNDAIDVLNLRHADDIQSNICYDSNINDYMATISFATNYSSELKLLNSIYLLPDLVNSHKNDLGLILGVNHD